MHRTVTRRIITPPSERVTTLHSIDLALVAHAAAVETLQIDLVARGWIGLFGALLEPGADGDELIWRENGPGGEAEIKRAYSAIFGRFFGRAILRHEHGCVDLRQVHDGMEIAPGIHIRRRVSSSTLGDLPDWVGWNMHSNCYSVCEAKGSHDRGNWESSVPRVVQGAMQQANRVELIDPTGNRVQTKNWVVASRWGTAKNGKIPTVITLDPLTAGRQLTGQEVAILPTETHALFLADLLRGLGRAGMAKEVETSEMETSAAGDTVVVAGREGFAAVLVDGTGLFPLRGPQRLQRLETLRGFAEETGRKVAVVAVERAAVVAAGQRIPRPDDHETSVEDNGQTVSSDGLTLTWNIDAVKVHGAT